MSDNTRGAAALLESSYEHAPERRATVRLVAHEQARARAKMHERVKARAQEGHWPLAVFLGNASVMCAAAAFGTYVARLAFVP